MQNLELSALRIIGLEYQLAKNEIGVQNCYKINGYQGHLLQCVQHNVR